MKNFRKLIVLGSICLMWGCQTDDNSTDNNGLDVSTDAADVSAETDVAEDAADSGDTSVDVDVSSEDAADAADVSCTQTWQDFPDGEEHCCPAADISCSLLDYVDTNSSQSNFDPATNVLTLVLKPGQTSAVYAAVSATVQESSGSVGQGYTVDVEGNISGNELVFDFSSENISPDEELVIDNLFIRDACDSSGSVIINTAVDPNASSVHTDFDCSAAPPF